jgi:hypothetical protein
MYFKVNHTGCGERKGLVEIRYDLYLDPTDHNYSEHHIQVPVIPEGGYTGKVDEMGAPVNQKDYDKWFAALPRVWQNNPFCCHFMQFEPEITDAEIIAAGEKFLKMAYANWQKGNLHLNKNEPVHFIDHLLYKEIAKPFVEMERDLAAKGTPLDYDGDPIGVLVDAKVNPETTEVQKDVITAMATNAVAKIKVSEARVNEVLATDFEALKVK